MTTILSTDKTDDETTSTFSPPSKYSSYTDPTLCLCRTGTTSTGLRGEGGVKGGGDNAVAMSCLILFPKDDGCAFKRIVGSKHAEQMVNGDKGAYLFYS